MSKEELIEEILDIIHSENSGLSTHQRVSEIEKVLNQNKEDERSGATSAYERISVIARMKDKTATGLTRDDLLNQNKEDE